VVAFLGAARRRLEAKSNATTPRDKLPLLISSVQVRDRLAQGLGDGEDGVGLNYVRI
jgi:hypothetical protein